MENVSATSAKIEERKNKNQEAIKKAQNKKRSVYERLLDESKIFFGDRYQEKT